ncbi:hypothetical protein HNY73_021121 [Argiope bruennichi]|uniref:Uncharacterized protein n=1 Tax=Argiope bruennichi TaxID=94029 RepID=A0A8T0EBS4_ARGBR|nr:hypothetical protein HNY73_021121 [Argiope bruennichi]
MYRRKTFHLPPVSSQDDKTDITAKSKFSVFKGLLLAMLSGVFYSAAAVIVKQMKNLHPGQLSVYRFPFLSNVNADWNVGGGISQKARVRLGHFTVPSPHGNISQKTFGLLESLVLLEHFGLWPSVVENFPGHHVMGVPS